MERWTKQADQHTDQHINYKHPKPTKKPVSSVDYTLRTQSKENPKCTEACVTETFISSSKGSTVRQHEWVFDLPFPAHPDTHIQDWCAVFTKYGFGIYSTGTGKENTLFVFQKI
jgi:hypothetical protein